MYADRIKMNDRPYRFRNLALHIFLFFVLCLGMSAVASFSQRGTFPPPKAVDGDQAEEETSDVDYSDVVHSAARSHGLDPELILAVIRIESGGDPKAVSHKGAKGLMQLTLPVCRYHGVDDPFDIEQNIRAGSAHLAYLLRVFGGDLERALAAYNCGMERVIEHDGIPPLRETQDFVRSVLCRYRQDERPLSIEEEGAVSGDAPYRETDTSMGYPGIGMKGKTTS